MNALHEARFQVWSTSYSKLGASVWLTPTSTAVCFNGTAAWYSVRPFHPHGSSASTQCPSDTDHEDHATASSVAGDFRTSWARAAGSPCNARCPKARVGRGGTGARLFRRLTRATKTRLPAPARPRVWPRNRVDASGVQRFGLATNASSRLAAISTASAQASNCGADAPFTRARTASGKTPKRNSRRRRTILV